MLVLKSLEGQLAGALNSILLAKSVMTEPNFENILGMVKYR